MTFREWFNHWVVNRSEHERLGQAFCNDFIKGVWTELFYIQDTNAAHQMIKDYLERNHYGESVPDYRNKIV
jgi:hypothetical protein